MRYLINSLLDMDFYKFTMGQLAFLKYFGVMVRYAFKNRSVKVKLANVINEKDLRRELDHVRTLRFSEKEIDYLRGLKKLNGQSLFQKEYLRFLAGLQLPGYELKVEGEMFELTFKGKWAEAIYWETIAMSIINELYYRAITKKMTLEEQEEMYFEGKRRLAQKIEKLKANPGLVFADFGTRRRFSRVWQGYVVRTLAKEVPTQLVGTSNVYLAMKYGLKPIGTNAHELTMIMSGIMHGNDEEVRDSHNQVLQDWWELYEADLSIALTDTYGSKFFFEDMTKEQAENWRGLRQDSGNPYKFGDDAIAFYEKHGVDPKEKLLLFSDGLDVDTMVALGNYFNGRAKIAFGWGTNLINDMGFDALSIVVKAVESCGYGLVKLSDNPAKAMGQAEDVERFKKIFGYVEGEYVECTY